MEQKRRVYGKLRRPNTAFGAAILSAFAAAVEEPNPHPTVNQKDDLPRHADVQRQEKQSRPTGNTSRQEKRPLEGREGRDHQESDEHMTTPSKLDAPEDATDDVSNKRRKLEGRGSKLGDKTARIPSQSIETTHSRGGGAGGSTLKRTGRLVGRTEERPVINKEEPRVSSRESGLAAGQLPPLKVQAARLKPVGEPRGVKAGKIKAKSMSQEVKDQIARDESQSPTPKTPTMSPRPIIRKAGSRSQKPQSDNVTVPSTPPRPIRAVVITPKQAELFSRLNSGTPRTSSPRSSTETELIPTIKIRSSSPIAQSPDPARKSPSRRRPRLIDSLDTAGILEEDAEDGELGTKKQTRSSYPGSSSDSQADSTAQDLGALYQEPTFTSSQGRARPELTLSGSQGAGAKVTYSTQRSYLSDQALSLAGPHPSLGGSAGFDTHESQDSQGQPKPGIDPFEFGDDVDGPADASTGAMRSIHELREAGGNNRIRQEFEANIEDLSERHSSLLAARRTALMSLATRMLEANHCRLFCNHGLHTRLFGFVEETEDPLERLLLLILSLELLANAGSKSLFMVDDESDLQAFWEFLATFLDQKDNVLHSAELRPVRLTKQTRADLERLYGALSKSLFWRIGNPTVLTGHIVALQCFEYLVRQIREFGYTEGLLSPKIVSRIVTTSIPASKDMEKDSQHVVLCPTIAISILESCTISMTSEGKADWPQSTHQKLRAFFVSIFDECSTSTYEGLTKLSLRLLLNLTNMNQKLCDFYASLPVVERLLQHITSGFQNLLQADAKAGLEGQGDSLVLTLGCLINFADISRVVYHSFSQLKSHHPGVWSRVLDLFHQGRKRAAQVCIDPGILEPKQSTDSRKVSSEEQGDLVVSYGYLSVLLTYLAVDEGLRKSIRDSCEAQGSDLGSTVFAAAEEFLQYHRQIDERLRQLKAPEQQQDHFVARAQGIIDGLRANG